MPETSERYRLDDFGDVLTDADLCALMGWPASRPRYERDRAHRLRRLPHLPAPVSSGKPYRYHRAAVEAWLTGSTVAQVVRMRRVS